MSEASSVTRYGFDSSMRALEEKADGSWVRFSDHEPVERERAALKERCKRLEEALIKANGDINWMLNNRQFLNADVFDYLDKILDEIAESRAALTPEQTNE